MRHILDEETISEMTWKQAKEIFNDFVYDSTRFLEILEAGGRCTGALEARKKITRIALKILRENWNATYHDQD